MKELHEDWLAQVETDGPFLALPVIKDTWPDGVDRLGDADDRMVTFKQAFVTWQREIDTFALADRTPEAKKRYAEVTRAWIETVLDELAGWSGLRLAADDLPASMEIRSPGEQVAVHPSGALTGRDSEYGALLLISEPTTSLRDTGLDGWAANELDRMAMLLRKAQVEVGIVTDGQCWAIVWAKDGKPTGSGMVNALTWAEEPLLRDAFLTLVDQRRFRAKDPEQRLPRLFERSELEAEEITEALGTQVRRSVELLVQAFSEARLAAARNHDPDPLAEDPDEVYQAAVTVMMRVVFLLFAEEREMLPTEQLYWDSYAIRDLLADLARQAVTGEEPLDESFDAWYRLLAVSQALYAGVNYDEMRMPAYGGSLLDPDRFPWMYATDQRGRLRLEVSDRVMLHVLQSVQSAVVRGERRRVSFRDIDVEQIGYIYEGLLGYSCAVVKDQVVLGLVGKEGEEPEIDADTLQGLYDDTADAKTFTAALLDWIKSNQPAAKPLTAAKLTKLYDAEADEADMRRLLTPIAGHDADLLGFLIDWGNYIRRDLRGIPLVVPVGGLVVVETPSRKNAGAHYTPRSLAEEVVLHALQPLVYEPGPLQTNDEDAWRLKSSSALLDLKVADIAAGSGAFLVAAARYLADRVAEAWTAEGRPDPNQVVDARAVNDQAIREVVARCLYGADINPMAVDMCKLSLWLISMDKTKPFSFVDDKIFCGNSLLGVTSIDQLRFLHIHPDPKQMDTQLLFDIDGEITEAARLRKELASPVDEHDPMRSTRGKLALLAQLRGTTAALRLVADGIIATGLPLGGKPGAQLDNAYRALAWELGEAFPQDSADSDMSGLVARINCGLMPSVETDYERWRPVHWAIEVPDVIVDREGFDAVIGNPPFLGVSAQSGALGENIRAWCTWQIAQGRRGAADLVAYFLLRAAQIVRPAGSRVGLIATASLAENETRSVGLDQLVDSGAVVTDAVRSQAWPAKNAHLRYCMVCLSWGAVAGETGRWLDGVAVRRISPSLDVAGRVDGRPIKLLANSSKSFEGSKVYGDGFVLDRLLVREFIAADSKNSEVIQPYLGGQEMNADPEGRPQRWVINFRDWSADRARRYELPFRRLEELVQPERAMLKMASRRDKWWQFGSLAKRLYEEIEGKTACLAMTKHSSSLAPLRVAIDMVFSHSLTVFALEEWSDLAWISSGPHQLWAITHGSTFGPIVRYTSSSVFDTFPAPQATARLSTIGKTLNDERRVIMRGRQLGLTALYNAVNDPNIRGNTDVDVDRMREIHAEVDESTIAAYGWDDLQLDHGFHTYRQMERWTVCPSARVEILDRLLELNHERARAEGQDVPRQGELF